MQGSMQVNTIQVYMPDPDARGGDMPRSQHASQWRDCCSVATAGSNREGGNIPSKEIIHLPEEARTPSWARQISSQQQELFRSLEHLLADHMDRVVAEVHSVRTCVEDRIPITNLLQPLTHPAVTQHTESEALKLPIDPVITQPPLQPDCSGSGGLGMEAVQSASSIDDRLKDDKRKAHEELMEVVGWTKIAHTTDKPSRFSSLNVERGMVQGCLWTVMNSHAMQALSSLLVFMYVLMIAFVLDYDVQRAERGEAALPWEATLDTFFNIVFLIELVLRMLASGKEFFTGYTRGWNLLDLFIVSTGLIELVQLLDFSLTYLRILRVIRVVRVMRILRLFRFFRDLRMMALSIFSCLVSLFWAFILLMMTMVVFAIALLEGEREYYRGDSTADSVRDGLKLYFPNLMMTVYHLLAAVTGGKDWTLLAQPFVDIHWFYGILFTVFIMFVMFGLLNVLIGVFVQSTGAIADIDRDFVIQEEMARNDSVMNQMRELFQHVDEDNSGTITWAELKENLANDQVKAYFSLLSLDVHEAQGLFHLLDMDESGEVGIEEFIMGCMRLKGTAKSIDLATLLYENKRLHKVMKRMSQKLDGDLYEIRRMLPGAVQSRNGSRSVVDATPMAVQGASRKV